MYNAEFVSNISNSKPKKAETNVKTYFRAMEDIKK